MQAKSRSEAATSKRQGRQKPISPHQQQSEQHCLESFKLRFAPPVYLELQLLRKVGLLSTLCTSAQWLQVHSRGV